MGGRARSSIGFTRLVAVAVAVAVCFGGRTLAGQTARQSGGRPAGQSKEGTAIPLSKARSLEARGRMDLAVLNWNQVLLVDPNQPEALAGLARSAREKGDLAGMRAYLDRLRNINPRDPAIAAIEHMHVPTPQELKDLNDAGRLAAAHRADEAVAIYRRVFGEQPPPGRWAEAFYETEAASTGGRDKAIAHLRALTAQDPTNEVYRLWLACTLTYDPKSRAEGLRLLESIHEPGSVEQARTAWRQALIWERDNPSAQASLETYLQRHPDDELQRSLTTMRG